MTSGQLAFAIVTATLLADGSAVLAAGPTQPASEVTALNAAIETCVPRRIALLDDDDDDEKRAPSASAASNGGSSRYCLGLLDHRSSYGRDFFPDPFLGPEFDAERQLELDYLHSEKRGVRNDEIDAGFQWNIFGQMTIAGEFGWDSEHQINIHTGAGGEGDDNPNSRGFENVDLAIYHPLFQYVSTDDFFDYTAIARLGVGIPTRTAASGTDLQLTPFLGHLLRIGNHISLEAWSGIQFTIAPHQTDQLIYGASLGYQISREQLPLPFIEKLTPIIELDGQSSLSSQGQDALFGVAGADVNFRSLGQFDPHVEIGCQLPIDQGARDELRWGIITEVFVEF